MSDLAGLHADIAAAFPDEAVQALDDILGEVVASFGTRSEPGWHRPAIRVVVPMLLGSFRFTPQAQQQIQRHLDHAKISAA